MNYNTKESLATRAKLSFILFMFSLYSAHFLFNGAIQLVNFCLTPETFH